MLASLTTYLTFRRVALGVGAACAAAVITAIGLQHLLGWEPCPLCIMQRLALGATAIFALCAALTDRHFVASYSFRSGASIAALGGCAAAIAQLRLLANPEQASCAPGIRLYLLKMTDVFPSLSWLLDGPADCAADANLVLGLPLAFWTLALLALCAAVLWLPWRERSTKP